MEEGEERRRDKRKREKKEEEFVPVLECVHLQGPCLLGLHYIL